MAKPVSIRGHEEGRSLKVKTGGQITQGLIVANDEEAWTVVPYSPADFLPFRVPRGRQEGTLFFPTDSIIVAALGRVTRPIWGEGLAARIAEIVRGSGSAKSKWNAIAREFFGDKYHHHFHPPLMSGPELVRIEARGDDGYLLTPAGLRVPALEE